ncbi:MAG TPA: hypothetical protein VM870_05145 [Pyrinomonadaceae bacterium]|jgi:hypothetical protein|nr:hypothetical protein [Pyrinomonadaceae bacterium]
MTYLFAFTLSLMCSAGVYLLAARRRHDARRFRLHQRLEETLLPGKEIVQEMLPPATEPKIAAASFFARLKSTAGDKSAPRRAPAVYWIILSFLLGVLVSLITSALTVSLLIFIAIKTCGR